MMREPASASTWSETVFKARAEGLMAAFQAIRSERSGRYRGRILSYLRRLPSIRGSRDDRDSGAQRDERFQRLLAATAKCGPLGSLLRLYLATRFDLFSTAERRKLADVSPFGSFTPFSEIAQHVERELGCQVERVFLAVEPTPHTATEATLSYLALLHTGESVSITTLRPEFIPVDQGQMDALRSFCSSAFSEDGSAYSSPIFEAFEDELRQRLDLASQAETIAAIVRVTADSDVMFTPAIYPELCRPGVLVTEAIPSIRLLEVIEGYRERENDAGRPEVFPLSPHRLARVLCVAWLREVFLGRLFPVYCRADDVCVHREGRLAFLSGPYFDLQENAGEQLWEYLLAVAQDNPNECCRTLLLQTLGGLTEEKESDLIAQFRQAVTFFQTKHGEERYSGTAARIQRHLQIVQQAGLRLRPSAHNFYRGLFSLLTTVHDLRCDQDPLLDAIEDVWVTRIFGSCRQMMRTKVIADMANKYAAAMIEAPKTMNELLKSFGRGVQTDEASNYRDGHGRSGSHGLTGLFLLAAVILLVHGRSLQIPAWWADRISFVACCMAGLLALKIALAD